MEAWAMSAEEACPPNDQTSCNRSDRAIKAITYVNNAASTSNSILPTHAPQSSKSAFADNME
jgi:hypothetical protein